MSEISRVALFGKLNSLAYKAIEAATVFCKLRGNPYVERCTGSTRSSSCRTRTCPDRPPSGIDGAPGQDLTEALDRLPRGSTSITDLSSHVEEAVERGWVYGSLMFGESQVRTGYLVIGILKTPSLRHAPHRAVGGIRQAQGRGAHRALRRVRRRLAGERPVGQRRLQRRRRPGRASGAWRRARWASRRRSSALPWTSPSRPAAASSTPSSGVTRRSASWWTSSCAAGRTTRSSPARPASQDRGGGRLRPAHRRRRRPPAEGRRTARSTSACFRPGRA